MFSVQSTVNIIFDRVGKVDPVTRGIQIAIAWIGLDIDIKFWSQHVSFILVGIIVISSIRGLLITLTKVRERPLLKSSVNICSLFYGTVLLCNIKFKIEQCDRVATGSNYGHVLCLIGSAHENEHAT